MMSSQHAPVALGDTRATMAETESRDPARKGKLTSETRSQFGLQAATRLHEAGIASNRRSATRPAVNPFPFRGKPCTHRGTRHTMYGSWPCLKSLT